MSFCFTCEHAEAADLEGRLAGDLRGFFTWLNDVLYTRGWGCAREDFPIVVLGSPAQVEEMVALVLVKLTAAMSLSLRTVSEWPSSTSKMCPV